MYVSTTSSNQYLSCEVPSYRKADKIDIDVSFCVLPTYLVRI